MHIIWPIYVFRKCIPIAHWVWISHLYELRSSVALRICLVNVCVCKATIITILAWWRRERFGRFLRVVRFCIWRYDLASENIFWPVYHMPAIAISLHFLWRCILNLRECFVLRWGVPPFPFGKPPKHQEKYWQTKNVQCSKRTEWQDPFCWVSRKMVQYSIECYYRCHIIHTDVATKAEDKHIFAARFVRSQNSAIWSHLMLCGSKSSKSKWEMNQILTEK